MPIKRSIKFIEHSTDYAGDPLTATWTKIPHERLLANNSAPFGEDPVMLDLLGGGQIQAAADGSASYAVAYETDDTVAAPLRTALNAGTPVWIRETYVGGETLVAGGDTGCTGGSSVPSTTRGSVLVEVFNVTAPGAESGDTFTVAAAA